MSEQQKDNAVANFWQQAFDAGLNEGYAKGHEDGFETGHAKAAQIALDFFGEFAAAAGAELCKRLEIEDPNADQPASPDPIEQESASQPPVDVVSPVVDDHPVVDLTVTDVVQPPEPPAPTVVEGPVSLLMEVPAPTESSVAVTAPPSSDEDNETDEDTTEAVVRAADDDALSVLPFRQRLSLTRLKRHFSSVGELCRVPSPEALVEDHDGVGSGIADDAVQALDEKGRWLGDMNQPKS